MKTKILLLFLFVTFKAITVQAQTPAQAPKHRPVLLDPQKDRVQYNGFTIQLIPTLEGFYGYDIFNGGKLIVHQYLNPLPAKGLSNREDAFRVAKWVTDQYIKTGRAEPMLPPDIEKQLKLTTPN